MKKLSICCVAASAILLASCATTKVETVETAFADPILTGKWESVEFVKDGAEVTGSTATITFAEPTFAIDGNSGVNNYFGNVNINDTAFAAGDNIGSTMMAGEEGAMAFESAYLEAFAAANKIVRQGDKLVISGPSSKIVYVRNAEGVWETESVEKDGTAVTGAKATLSIAPIYAIDGNAGVNSFFGEAVANEGFFKVNPEGVGVTKMLGLPEAQAFEDAFINALSVFDAAIVEGDTLTISSDTAKISFKKAAETVAPIEPTSVAE